MNYVIDLFIHHKSSLQKTDFENQQMFYLYLFLMIVMILKCKNEFKLNLFIPISIVSSYQFVKLS